MNNRAVYHSTRRIWYHCRLASVRCKHPELQKYIYGVEHSVGRMIMHGKTSGSSIDLDIRLRCEKQPSIFARHFEGLEDEPQKRMHFLIEQAIAKSDMSCVATELPLKADSFEGFIDVLIDTENFVEVWDYKPGARYENALAQVAYYAELLSELTNLPINIFKIGWFDEVDSFQTVLDYETHVKFTELGVTRMDLWQLPKTEMEI